jgi:hypothetical protein
MDRLRVAMRTVVMTSESLTLICTQPVDGTRAAALEDRVRELERLLGRKTMEVEILKEVLDLARLKKAILAIDGHWGDETTSRIA